MKKKEFEKLKDLKLKFSKLGKQAAKTADLLGKRVRKTEDPEKKKNLVQEAAILEGKYLAYSAAAFELECILNHTKIENLTDEP